MIKIKMKLAILIVVVTVLISFPAIAKLVPLSNCAQLKKPKTILAVHASWCPVCQKFMPLYENLSNDPKYTGWVFYEKTDDDWSVVCGVEIADVPHLFVNNMKVLPDGGDLEDLIKYLNKH